MKFHVALPTAVHRVELLGDALLEMSLTVESKGVLRQKDYVFEFKDSEDADVFCEETTIFEGTLCYIHNIFI